MCSRRSRTDPGRGAQRGFTVLECEIAILILVVLAYGVMSLVSAHEVLVTDMQGVAADDSTWYVSQPDEQLQRWLGQPATLGADPVPSSYGGTGVGGGGDVYELDVLDASYGLVPLSASAQIHLTEL